MRLLILVLVLGLTGWTMTRVIRDRATQSPALRRHFFIRGGIALVLGLVIARWLPRRVPETQGSPATMVILLVIWVIGGGLAFVGVATIVGALLARPSTDGPTQ